MSRRSLYASGGMEENRSPRFTNGVVLRKTPSLKRRERSERDILSRDFTLELQDYEMRREMFEQDPANVRKQFSEPLPDPTEINMVRRRYGAGPVAGTQFSDTYEDFMKRVNTLRSLREGGPAVARMGQAAGSKPSAPSGTARNEFGGEVMGGRSRPVLSQVQTRNTYQDGARISARSFSAGEAQWKGRVDDSVTENPANMKSDFSLRDNWDKGGNLSGGRSLFDQKRFSQNRAVEARSTDTVVGKFNAWKQDNNRAEQQRVESFLSEMSMSDEDYMTTMFGGSTKTASLGGDVDTTSFLSTALAKGVGDPKLLRAAIRGGSADLSKRYTNLSKLGVI